ncbi:hypothetical protein IJN73_02285 [Candidatus Saccharibacteria bacterium]|nr:hypothetical protein [Candidatus Saccharibacteria bacterium]
MSTKKAVKRVKQPSRALALLSFGFVIIALPAFILLSFYAYTLIFIGNDTTSIARGVTILVLMVASLGFVIFNRR